VMINASPTLHCLGLLNSYRAVSRQRKPMPINIALESRITV
jgi:hypothetical protein